MDEKFMNSEIVYLVLFGIAWNQNKHEKQLTAPSVQDSESCISAACTHPRSHGEAAALHGQTQGGAGSAQEPQRVEDPCPHPLLPLQAWPPLTIVLAAGWRASWIIEPPL